MNGFYSKNHQLKKSKGKFIFSSLLQIMDKKEPKDNLENLFGKMFNNTEEVVEGTGWDVPPADVWDNIQMGLKEEKEPDRIVGYWWWIGTAASFLLLISAFQCYQYKKIQELTHQLDLKEKAVNTIQLDLEDLIYQKEQKEKLTIAKNNQVNAATGLSEEKEGVPSIRRTPSLKELSIKNKEIEKTPIANQFNNFPSKKRIATSNRSKSVAEILARSQVNKVAPLGKKELGNKTKDLQNQELAINIPNKIAVAKNMGDVSISKLPTLFSLLETEDKVIPPTIHSIVPIIKNNPSFYLAADYATYWEERKVKRGRFSEANPFFVSESQQKSFTTGLQFGVKLGKGWIVETGFRYLNSKISAQHTGKIPYPILEEKLINQGFYESTLNVQLGAPAEAVETEVVLSRSSATTVESNTVLNLDIAYSTSLSALDIPLLVKKQWTIGNLGLSINAGLLNRFIMENKLETFRTKVDDPRFQSRIKPNEERISANKLSTYSPHVLAGFGMEYQIQPKLSIYAEPTFVRSIRPIAEIGFADIYAEGKMVNFGIRYQL